MLCNIVLIGVHNVEGSIDRPKYICYLNALVHVGHWVNTGGRLSSQSKDNASQVTGHYSHTLLSHSANLNLSHSSSYIILPSVQSPAPSPPSQPHQPTTSPIRWRLPSEYYVIILAHALKHRISEGWFQQTIPNLRGNTPVPASSGTSIICTVCLFPTSWVLVQCTCTCVHRCSLTWK